MCVICGQAWHQAGGTSSDSYQASAPAIEPLSPAALQDRIDAVTFDLAVDRLGTSPSTTLTYRFAGSSQPRDFDFGSYSGWTPFGASDQAAMRSALNEFEEIINVRFVESDGPDPDLDFGRVDMPYGGEGGLSYSYYSDGTVAEYDGFAVFNNDYSLTTAYGRNLVLHEIGHAMSLKHPGNYNAGGGGSDGPYLPAGEDNNRYTVMSYNDNPDTGSGSLHLMLYDIAALQHRWGANMTTRTGNDVYTGPRSPGADAIWDAGGYDTISAGARSSAVEIDLRAGAFSSLGAPDNLAIAYGATIEQAIGGSGADRLAGNGVANSLLGRAGADTIRGGLGEDRIVGGQGADTLRGCGGADSFLFASARDRGDTVVDFASPQDTFQFRERGFGFENELDLGDNLFIGARVRPRNDEATLLYERGVLSYDTDGTGSRDEIVLATLSNKAALGAADFDLI